MNMAVDIETYSSVDLAKAGVRPYTEAPDFAVLLIGYRISGQVTKLIDLVVGGESPPSLLPGGALRPARRQSGGVSGPGH